MKKRAKLSKRRISVILILLMGVSFVISKYFDSSLVGKAIAIKDSVANIPNSAIIVIAGAWAFFITLFIIAFVRDKVTSKKEVSTLNIPSRYGKYKTDLDVLYEVLKEHKRVRIKILAKAFKISSEKAMEWAKILESGHLVTIEYPGIMGDPEARVIENAKEDEKDKGEKEQEKK